MISGGRPCTQADCQLVKLHLGSTFAASILTKGFSGEISAYGKGSDQSRFNGWRTSPTHNEIMLANDNDIFGCFNDPNGEFSHCDFFQLDKVHPNSGSGTFYVRPCA